MTCQRCGRENDAKNRFCGRCGSELKDQQIPTQLQKSDTKFCYRHPKEATLLSCGRCERPICTKCVVIGPAGPRCPECARHNVKVSAQGIAHDLVSGIKRTFRGSPYSLYWIILFFVLFGGLGRMMCRPSPPIEFDRTPPPTAEGQSQVTR